jgi:hypothetical protein
VRTGVLIVAETFYHLVEYDALNANREAYVAGWDYRGARRVAEFADRAAKLLDRLLSLSAPEGKIETLLEMHAQITARQDPVLEAVRRIIAEEERIRWETEHFPKGYDISRPGFEILGPGERPSLTALFMASTEPRALRRPAIDLLARPGPDVSGGIQFEASDLLGRLSDIRSLDTLLASMRTCDPRHEEACVELAGIIQGPDHMTVRSAERQEEYQQSLIPEKREAVWAMGKLGPDAVHAIPLLKRQADSTDRETCIYTAWAAGVIGKGQKHKSGGIDVLVLTTLMNLLTSEDGEVFEEGALALRGLELPDFLHALYLQDFTKVPILCLKASTAGLSELSETLLNLISLKRPVVMAVTGDSGTGKTYFCETIAGGFGEIRPSEILYLMRDRTGDKTLDRILGIRWLRKHIAQEFHQDYPVSESKDDPDIFFEEFVATHQQEADNPGRLERQGLFQ